MWDTVLVELDHLTDREPNVQTILRGLVKGVLAEFSDKIDTLQKCVTELEAKVATPQNTNTELSARITLETSTCIDLTFTNKEEMVSNHRCISHGFSDYDMIFYSRKKGKSKNEIEYIKVRSFNKFNEVKCCRDLTALD